MTVIVCRHCRSSFEISGPGQWQCPACRTVVDVNWQPIPESKAVPIRDPKPNRWALMESAAILNAVIASLGMVYAAFHLKGDTFAAWMIANSLSWILIVLCDIANRGTGGCHVPGLRFVLAWKVLIIFQLLAAIAAVGVVMFATYAYLRMSTR